MLADRKGDVVLKFEYINTLIHCEKYELLSLSILHTCWAFEVKMVVSDR